MATKTCILSCLLLTVLLAQISICAKPPSEFKPAKAAKTPAKGSDNDSSGSTWSGRGASTTDSKFWDSVKTSKKPPLAKILSNLTKIFARTTSTTGTRGLPDIKNDIELTFFAIEATQQLLCAFPVLFMSYYWWDVMSVVNGINVGLNLGTKMGGWYANVIIGSNEHGSAWNMKQAILWGGAAIVLAYMIALMIWWQKRQGSVIIAGFGGAALGELSINLLQVSSDYKLTWWMNLSVIAGAWAAMILCALFWPDHTIIVATSFLGSYQFFRGIGILFGTFPYSMAGGRTTWWVYFGLSQMSFVAGLTVQFWLRSVLIKKILEEQGHLSDVEIQNEDHSDLKIGMWAKGYGYDLRRRKYKDRDAKGVVR